MSGKKILYKDDARKALMNGMNIMLKLFQLHLVQKVEMLY